MSSRKHKAGSDAIPTLTDVVEVSAPSLDPQLLAALQTEITAQVLRATEELLQEAGAELAAVLVEHVNERLRATLPELIEKAVRERLGRD